MFSLAFFVLIRQCTALFVSITMNMWWKTWCIWRNKVCLLTSSALKFAEKSNILIPVTSSALSHKTSSAPHKSNFLFILPRLSSRLLVYLLPVTATLLLPNSLTSFPIVLDIVSGSANQPISTNILPEAGNKWLYLHQHNCWFPISQTK